MAGYLERNNLLLPKIYKRMQTQTWYFQFYQDFFFEKAVRMFEYDEKKLKQLGIPSARVIEYPLIWGSQGGAGGQCCYVFNDKEAGSMVAQGNPFNRDNFLYQGIEFDAYTYAAPNATGGTIRIGDKDTILKGKEPEGVLIRNNSTMTSLQGLIIKYALRMAKVEVSIDDALVNSRKVDTLVVKKRAGAAAKKYLEDREEGIKNAFIVDESFDKNINALNLGSGYTTGLLAELEEIRNKEVTNFYAEIGVKVAQDKKERMIVDEVAANNQYYLLNINDMIRCRQAAFEEIGNYKGVYVEPKLSPEFEVITVEDTEDSEPESENKEDNVSRETSEEKEEE